MNMDNLEMILGIEIHLPHKHNKKEAVDLDMVVDVEEDIRHNDTKNKCAQNISEYQEKI